MVFENCTQTARVYWSENPYWIERYFLNCRIFPNLWCLLYQSVSHRLKYYHYVSVPLFIKSLDFSIYLLIPVRFVYSGKNRSPNTPHQLAWYSQSDRRKILEPPCIGHWTPLPKNLGYRTQVWDKDEPTGWLRKVLWKIASSSSFNTIKSVAWRQELVFWNPNPNYRIDMIFYKWNGIDLVGFSLY